MCSKLCQQRRGKTTEKNKVVSKSADYPSHETLRLGPEPALKYRHIIIICSSTQKKGASLMYSFIRVKSSMQATQMFVVVWDKCLTIPCFSVVMQ